MTTMISSGTDVVDFLKQQHEQIRAMFAQVKTTNGQQRRELFYSLRRLLAVHETAEEEIVHPAARSAVPNGEAVVSVRLAEENKAKKELSEMEDLELDSADFEARFNTFTMSVLAHAEAEEAQEFGPLAESLDSERLERMRRAVELAERVAPTRPHPGVESQAANLLAGPFAAMLDRARDLLSGKANKSSNA